MDYKETTQEEKKYEYVPDGTYNYAMGQLQTLKENMPQYKPEHDKALQDLYKQITERPKFSYSAADDALYQSYKQSYAQQGRMAMEDTMGAAAALTGGYGSTYSQSVGGQAYDAYLQKLSQVFPETYGMAYQQYLDEGNALMDQYSMLSAQEDKAYQRYKDDMDNYYREMGILQDAADTAYDYGQDAYNRLADMIVTLGYVPDEAELAAAGMTEKQMEAYQNYYKSLHAVGSGGGGKDVTQTKDYKNNLYSALSQLDEGKTVEEINHEILNQVISGKLDADTAGELMAAITKEAFR